MKTVIKTIEIILMNKPVLIISLILICLLLKTIALGGVAIGSMKAHEEARIAETIRK